MSNTLTNAEWIIMTALWDNPNQPLKNVIQTVGDNASWNYRTYASFLRKLVEKGFAGANRVGKDLYYYPKVERGQCIREESISLLGKVREAYAKELVMCLIREGGLSGEDKRELKGLIDSLMKEEGSK